MPIHCTPIERGFENILKHDIKVKINTYNKDNKPVISNYNRCGLGTTLGSIGYDGSIYGCQEQTSKTKDNIFYLGNIFEQGIEKERHIRLLTEYTKIHVPQCANKMLCNTCPLIGSCDSMKCPSTDWDLYKNFHIDHEIHCLWNMWIFEKCAYLMKKMVNENNKIFKEYLDKSCNYNKYFTDSGEVIKDAIRGV